MISFIYIIFDFDTVIVLKSLDDGLKTADYIQFGMLLVLILALCFNLWQIILQNRLHKFQILKDQFELYNTYYQPVSKENIEEVKLHPSDYLEPDKFDKYIRNDELIRKYLKTMALYEFLIFSYSLNKNKVPHFLELKFEDWFKTWVSKLSSHSEFQDVNSFYKAFYPEFSQYLKDIIKDK